MGSLIGYMANRADRLLDALQQERAALTLPGSGETTGWGIGFYQGGEVLHKKRPLLKGDELDLEAIAKDVRSDCVIVHLRQATVGDFRSANTHPFRMRSWLFAHKGTIERFALMRDRLIQQVPDFLRRNIRGETDSEHLFHLILSFLDDAGQLDNLDADDRLVLNAIRSAIAVVDRMSAEEGAAPGTLNMVLTNGRRMYAVRRGAPVALVEREGVADTREDDRNGRRYASSPTFRYVMVVSGTTKIDHGTALPGYRALDEGSVCVIDRNLNLSFHAL